MQGGKKEISDADTMHIMSLTKIQAKTTKMNHDKPLIKPI